MNKTIFNIVVVLVVIIGMPQEVRGQELNQAIEQLERNVDALQETIRMLTDGQQMREADLENREALIMRLRYQMELLSRLTDEQYISIIQELGGDSSKSRFVYIHALPLLEWSIMADLTRTAEQMSVDMKIEEFISVIERQLDINP